MRDPLDEQLDALKRVSVFPSPDPVLVRRRGDRLRRRTAAVKACGVALAVALSATSVISLTRHPGPDGPEPADHPLGVADMVAVHDLPARRELAHWKALSFSGSALACVPARVVNELGASEMSRRSYGAVRHGAPAGGALAGQVRETLLAFPDTRAAHTALRIVVERLRSHCAATDLASADPVESQVLRGQGAGVWEMYERTADEVCTECDAAYFDRQAAVRVGDRLVLLSFSELGGPEQPDGLKAAMSRLVGAAVERADPSNPEGHD